jgi:hypothetical protein
MDLLPVFQMNKEEVFTEDWMVSDLLEGFSEEERSSMLLFTII